MNRDSASDGKAKPKEFLRPSRVVLWIVILVGLGVIAWDGSARLAYNGTFKSVSSAMEAADKDIQGAYKKDLDNLVKGWPHRSMEADNIELFKWKGLLQTYQMRLVYGSGELVRRIE